MSLSPPFGRTLRSLLGALVLASALGPPPARAESLQAFHFDDEHELRGWRFDGVGGIDRGLGFARSGPNNAWLRASHGWNAVWREVPAHGTVCRLWANRRTSANAPTISLSIIDRDSGIILGESRTALIGIGDESDWQLSLTDAQGLYPGQPLIIRFGFEGNQQDAWVQVDDVTLQCG